MARFLVVAALLLAVARPTSGQEIHWKSEFLFYLDNTEFFTPYRTGETILGSWFKTYLELKTGGNTCVRAGVFGDHRSGDGKFLDPVKPILAFRWQSDHSLAVLGTLEPHDRHGYLEPLEVTTLEFARPFEYGLEWVEDQERFHVDGYLNWQHLNTGTSREIFDTGFVSWWKLAAIARLEGQLHVLHHGGQLHDVGPVNNKCRRRAGPEAREGAPRTRALVFLSLLSVEQGPGGHELAGPSHSRPRNLPARLGGAGAPLRARPDLLAWAQFHHPGR